MMKFYDVTMPIFSGMQVYKNKEEKQPSFTSDSSINKGDSSNELRLSINLHTGTHMDFPLHMIKDGANSDSLNLKRLIRKVKVFDLTAVTSQISVDDLTKLSINHGDSVLFKTKNSFSEHFDFDFVALDKSGAEYLADLNVNLVGIDGLGIERAQSGHPTHKTLMAKDIYIIEGLRLKDVASGEYMMYALPLKTKATDALLLSVILVDEA